jgi:hypothetical protein
VQANRERAYNSAIDLRQRLNIPWRLPDKRNRKEKTAAPPRQPARMPLFATPVPLTHQLADAILPVRAETERRSYPNGVRFSTCFFP